MREKKEEMTGNRIQEKASGLGAGYRWLLCVMGLLLCLGWNGSPVKAETADLVITTPREMKEFAASISNGKTYWGKLVALGNDIVFDGTLNDYPVPTGEFAGTFDGRGHCISGIKLINTGKAALFYRSSGVVKNLTVKDCNFQGSSVSGIAVESYGTILNCAVVGGTYKADSFGGIVTTMKDGAIVRNCYTMGMNVDCTDYCGGIVGLIHGDNCTIQNCCNHSKVSSSGEYLGGILGWVYYYYPYLEGFKMENCYNTGVLTGGKNSTQGSLIGHWSRGLVSNCYADEAACPQNFGVQGGQTLLDSKGEAKAYTSSYMQSAEFLDQLNKNRGSHTDWSKWEIRSESPFPLPAKPESIAGASVTVGNTVYNGEEQKPVVTVIFGGKVLSLETDYTVTYTDNINAGQAKVLVSGMGMYTGECIKEFTIAKAKQTILCQQSFNKVIGDEDFYLNAKLQSENTGGTLSYKSSNTKVASVASDGYYGGMVTPTGVGKAVITIEAEETDNYAAGICKVSITVKPKKVTLYSVRRAGSKLKVSWSWDSYVQGYQIQYSTDKKFKKNVKTITVKSNRKTVCKSKKIKKKKKYYVRVRGYGGGVYGAWSGKRKV